MPSRRSDSKPARAAPKWRAAKTAPKPKVPAHLQALWNAAEESFQAEEFGQSAQIAAELLRREPGLLCARRLLGRALAYRGAFEDASLHLELVADHVDATPEDVRWLADSLREAGREGAADDAYRRLLRYDARDVHALNELGALALAAGRLSEAHDWLRQAFDLAPDYPGVSLNFARSRRFGAADARLAQRMRRASETQGLSASVRADILFGLAKVEGDQAEYERAFADLLEANKLMKAQLRFDRAQHRESIDRLVETFTPALFGRCRGFGCPSERPILVVGMPRSGTSLVEQILSAHPQVHGGGELDALDKVARGLPGRLGCHLNYPRAAAQMTQSAAFACGQEYLATLDELGGQAFRVTDKLPTNFAHLGLAALIVPGARVIHCRRHPMALGLSIFEQQFEQGHGWAYDLGDIAFFYASYSRLLAHWRAVLPLPMLEVDYESLVGDQEAISRELVAFCGLAWDDACIEFHRVERQVRTASNWQVRQPMYSSSVERWRRHEAGLGPLRHALLELGQEIPPDRP